MGTYFKNQFAEEHRIFAAKDDSFRKKIKASSVKLTAISRYLLLSLFLMMILYLTLQVSLASRGPITYSSDICDIIEEIPGKLDLENQDIADTAMDIAGDYPGEYSINQITQIYNALARSRGWFYYSDQANKNSFQNANHTLYMGKIKDTIGVGDCDDFAILMASLLQSIGGSTRIIFAYDEQNNTGHAYTEVYLGERDSPQVDSLLHWLKKEYKVEEIQGLNNTTNETWLNLDWGSDIAEAAYPGAAYFGEGCNNIKKYIIWESNTQNPPTIVPIIDDMESIDGWKMINDTDGSSINISSNLGKENGNAIQISYDLKEIGWVGILREINPEMLSMSSGLKFSYFGMERQDDIELRLEYDDGTTFGISRKPIIGDDMWHSVDAFYSDFECLISSGQNKSLELDLNKIKFIEIIISSNDDEEIVGHGDIIVDDLRGVMAIPSASPWARIEEQKSRNQSIDLASKSRMIRGDSGESLWKSFIYALISMSTYTTRAGYQALREDLEIMPCPVACLPHNDTIYAIAFSPDCKRITTVGSDDYIRS